MSFLPSATFVVKMDEEPHRHNESEPESDQETIQTSYASDNIIENHETSENDGTTSYDNVYNSYNKPGPRGRPVVPFRSIANNRNVAAWELYEISCLMKVFSHPNKMHYSLNVSAKYNKPSQVKDGILQK